MRRWTDSELLSLLVDFHKKHGRSPKRVDFNRIGLPAPVTYQRRFGSWNNALEKAGLPLVLKTSSKDWKNWSDDKLLSEFEKEYKRIKPKNEKDFNRRRTQGFPTINSITNNKGYTWVELKEKIGEGRTYNADKWWILQIEKLITEKGEIPSYTEAIEKIGAGLRSFLLRYGKPYNDLLLDLGYDPKFRTPRRVEETNRELIDMYIKFSKKLGRPATSLDIEENEEMYSTSVFTHRFGGINKLREKAGLQVTTRRDYKFSKEFFTDILTEILNTKGRVTDEELKKLMKEYGTSYSSLLKYFRKTNTREIWSEIEKRRKW